MKKKVYLVLVFVICFFVIFKLITSENEIGSDFVPGELIVKYQSNVQGMGHEVFLEDKNEFIIYENVNVPIAIEKIAYDEIYVLTFKDEENMQAILDEYAHIKEIEYVELNYRMKTFRVPNDTNYSLKYDLHTIGAEEAWNLSIGNSSIVIAIIDTGVDWNHPDLSAHIWNNTDEYCNASDNDNNGYAGDCRGYDFVNVSSGCHSTEDCATEDNDPMDFHGHGTHTSGIAAAVTNNSLGIVGICWDCTIMPVRAGYLDTNNNGALDAADVVQALHYATDNNAAIISMSFGGTHSVAIQDAINYSYNKSVILVASAGNNGANTQLYPCGYDNVICVAATDSDNTSASYSNYGTWVDIAAPGTSVWSTYFDDRYTSESGTSMSAPLVAGAIGLLKTVFPGKNQSEIKQAINETGIAVDFSGTTINHLNIYNAFLELDNIAPNVALIYPTNNKFNLTLNQTFSCNATDWQLKNISLHIWNSSGLFFNETKNVSGIFNSSIFNAALSYGIFTWNCLVSDNESNRAYASSNFTLFVENITVSLLNPLNNTQKKVNSSFNCSAETESSKVISNITFRLWNSSALVYNLTQSFSGSTNSTNFSYNFSYEGNYFWNCKAYNNESEFDNGDVNFTFVYDITPPNISLYEPSDGSSYTSNSQSITFSFNVSDGFDIANCSLIVDGIINKTNLSVNKNINQYIGADFGPGTYTWTISCSDTAENAANTSLRSFTVSAPSSGSSGGGGGGGGGGGSSASTASLSPTKTYVISPEQSISGYTQKLTKKNKIKFVFFDRSGENILLVNESGTDFAQISIINKTEFTLGIGQSIKLNLTSSEYYDLYVKLGSINGNEVEITIQTINEFIVPLEIQAVSEIPEEMPTSVTEPKAFNRLLQVIRDLKIIIYMIVLLIILAVIILLRMPISKMEKDKRGQRLNKKKNETIKTISSGK